MNLDLYWLEIIKKGISWFFFNNFLITFKNKKNRVKEGKFPEYEETLNIQNVSPLDSEVNFCFLEESTDKADSCFFLEPNELSLKPNETKVNIFLLKY